MAHLTLNNIFYSHPSQLHVQTNIQACYMYKRTSKPVTCTNEHPSHLHVQTNIQASYMYTRLVKGQYKPNLLQTNILSCVLLVRISSSLRKIWINLLVSNLLIHSELMCKFCCHWWFDLTWFIVLNDTFSNISAISWRPALVVEEAGVPGENHHHGQATGKLDHLRLLFECNLYRNLQSRGEPTSYWW
jgi:hypothetical protein